MASWFSRNVWQPAKGKPKSFKLLISVWNTKIGTFFPLCLFRAGKLHNCLFQSHRCIAREAEVCLKVNFNFLNVWQVGTLVLCSLRFSVTRICSRKVKKDAWMKLLCKYKSQRETMYGLHHCVLKSVQYLIFLILVRKKDFFKTPN